MKIIKYFLLVLMLILTIVISNINNDKLSYISLGDGLSKGVNGSDYESNGYSDYLYRYLLKNNKVKKYSKKFTNEDMRIVDLMQMIKNNDYVYENNKKITIQNEIKNANIITISIGLNELLYKYSNNKNISHVYSYVDKNLNNLDNLIEIIKKLNNKSIYLLGYYNPTYDENLEEVIIYSNNKIKELCDKYDIIYIDTFNIFKHNMHLIYNINNYYPNKDGYKLISNSIKNKLNFNK